MVSQEFPSTAALPVRPPFLRRWLLDPILRQLTQGVTPRKIALTLAIGSALALFPILGTSTALCFLAGVAFGLNQPIIQGVNALCTVIYYPLIAVSVRLGERLAGAVPTRLDVPAMGRLLAHDPGAFLRQFGVAAAHGALGWAVWAPFWTALVYAIALPLLKSASMRLRRT